MNTVSKGSGGRWAGWVGREEHGTMNIYRPLLCALPITIGCRRNEKGTPTTPCCAALCKWCLFLVDLRFMQLYKKQPISGIFATPLSIRSVTLTFDYSKFAICNFSTAVASTMVTINHASVMSLLCLSGWMTTTLHTARALTDPPIGFLCLSLSQDSLFSEIQH